MSSVAASASSATSKSHRILACVLCQHRKIKCDRSFPCANCVKANVQCTPSTPAPARKRRRPNQDLQERLARCEELLKEYATEGKPDATATPTRQSISPHQTPKLGEQSLPNMQPGKLIHEDGGVRFVDSYMVSTIYEELKAMRDIVDNDETSPDDDTSDGMTPDTNADLLLGGETPSSPASSADLQPEPGHIFRLWQIFLDRVNPLIKIIHVPTLQPYLADATNRSQTALPKNIEALLFAIYNLATVALSEEECQVLLGYNRDTALQRFSSGVRLCLNRLGFLKTHDITTLQALLLYLISLQGRYDRHAAWILNGVVVRIGQKMGLHRDGTSLGLSPFETEMRRRLWWQIVALDAKYALMSGIGHSLLPRMWDTKEPRNLNDADLHASATELAPDRDGPTEMVFILVQNKLTRFIVDTPGLDPAYLFDEEHASNFPGGPTKEQIREYRAMFEMLGKGLVELTEKRCDPSAGPLHEFTLDFKTAIMEKLRDLLTPEAEKARWGIEVHTHKDHVFRMSVDSLDHFIRHYRNAQRTGFMWYLRLQFSPELFSFLAAQLCNRSSGPVVDKAWEVIEDFLPFHPELLNPSASKENLILGTLLFRAWKAREDTFAEQVGFPLPTPQFIVQLRESLPPQCLKTDSPSAPRVDSQEQEIKLPADMDTSFDQFLGNYIDGDWDVFSNMNIGPVPNPGIKHEFQNSNAGINGNMTPNANNLSQLPNTFGLFGLGPTTEW